MGGANPPPLCRKTSLPVRTSRPCVSREARFAKYTTGPITLTAPEMRPGDWNDHRSAPERASSA